MSKDVTEAEAAEIFAALDALAPAEPYDWSKLTRKQQDAFDKWCDKRVAEMDKMDLPKTTPAITKAINAFEAAVHDLAFKGTYEPERREQIEEVAIARRIQLIKTINRALAKKDK